MKESCLLSDYGKPCSQYREVISLLSKGYSVRDVAKSSGKGVSTVQRVKRLIKVQSSHNNNTFKVTNCDLKNKDRNMADNIEHQDKGELVANCDLKRRMRATFEIHALRIY